jgi:hypothetical protein
VTFILSIPSAGTWGGEGQVNLHPAGLMSPFGIINQGSLDTIISQSLTTPAMDQLFFF